jgi:hypothetical protein
MVMILQKALPPVIAMILLGLNLITASWWPVPWTDEALFLDPAATWFFQESFTSSLWHTQPYGEFWISNAPGYSLTLAGWLKVFGFSLLSSRSLNMVLQAILVWICTNWAQKQMKFKPLQLVLLALLLSWPNSAAFMARSGRYDMMACLCSTLMVLSLLNGRSVRIAVIVTGVLMPWICLPALAFTAVAAVLLGPISGRWIRIILHLGSAVMGFLALWLFAEWQLGEAKFLPILGSLWLGPSTSTKSRLLFENLLGLGADRFWLVTIGFISAYLLWQKKVAATLHEISYALGAWLASGLIAAVICAVLYKMNILYWWMLGVPFAFLLSSFDRMFQPKYPLFALLISGTLIVLGLPLRLLIGASQLHQASANSQLIRETLARIKTNNVISAVYVNWPFYYEVKPHSAIVIGPNFLGKDVVSDLQPALAFIASGENLPKPYSALHKAVTSELGHQEPGEGGSIKLLLRRLSAGPINHVPEVQVFIP